jgi:hypothetical protein
VAGAEVQEVVGAVGVVRLQRQPLRAMPLAMLLRGTPLPVTMPGLLPPPQPLVQQQGDAVAAEVVDVAVVAAVAPQRPIPPNRRLRAHSPRNW